MLKNIVFDMGGVLICYDPERFLAREASLSAEERALLGRAVFYSPDWPLMDSGELTEAQMEKRALPKLPERLHGAAHRLIFSWEQPILPIPGMAELARECKAKGLGVFLLSNASLRQREYWPLIPGHEVFDGGVVSAFVRQVKPGPAIFHCLFDKYGLVPGECLFVDDVQANVEGARRVGMRAVRFDGDAEALRRRIAEEGVLLDAAL